MLTERKIKFALFNAQKRWVDVKIILEHSPYLATNINKKYFEEYKNAGINIVWSNAKNYYLNHSTLLIIIQPYAKWCGYYWMVFKCNGVWLVFKQNDYYIFTL